MNVVHDTYTEACHIWIAELFGRARVWRIGSHHNDFIHG